MTVPATCSACRHMRTDRMDDGTDHTYCDGPRSLGATRAEEAPPPWCWLRTMTPMTRAGRPTGPQGARTARLVVRVTPADLAAYQAAAGRAGVSMGEWVRARLADGDWSANRSHDWSEVNGRRCARCHVRRTDEGASAFCTQQGAWTAAAEKEHGG